jgi:TRAP-type C4-dicarboxylate transport system permease small subunit
MTVYATYKILRGGHPMKLFRYADSATEFLSNILRNIACVAVISLILLVSISITLRTLHITYWLFVEEYTGYINVLIAYFMAADTLRAGNHITIDLIVTRIPNARVKQTLAVITSIVGLAMIIYFLKMSIFFTVDAWANKQLSMFPSQTPLWIPRVLVPIGLSVLVLALAMRVWGLIGDKKIWCGKDN